MPVDPISPSFHAGSASQIDDSANYGVNVTAGTSLTLDGANHAPVSLTTTPGTVGTANALVAQTGGATTNTGAGVGGAGAAWTITGGTGGASAAGTTSNTGGAGGAVTLASGTGGAGSSAGGVGGAGGLLTIVGGAGGAGATTGGVGGAIAITGGAAGSSGNAAGGNITINGGAGTGTGRVGSLAFGAGMFATASGTTGVLPLLPSNWSGSLAKWIRCFNTVTSKDVVVPCWETA